MNAVVDMGAMNSVMDLIFSRWKSQVLYAATELDIFDHLNRLNPKSTRRLAEELNLDLGLLYRLMRALSAIQLVREVTRDEFVLTAAGETLRADHPRSLKHIALLEEGPEHYAIWKHLTEMVRDGYDPRVSDGRPGSLGTLEPPQADPTRGRSPSDVPCRIERSRTGHHRRGSACL